MLVLAPIMCVLSGVSASTLLTTYCKKYVASAQAARPDGAVKERRKDRGAVDKISTDFNAKVTV